jgi:hypothetical protein
LSNVTHAVRMIVYDDTLMDEFTTY